MKAVVCQRSGSPDVLKLTEVEKPVPKPNEILVKVRASSVTRGDVIMRNIPRFLLNLVGGLLGFKAMIITGVEFSGEVEAVGSGVVQWKKGDRIFGTTTGLKFGGNAEYVCVPEQWKSGVAAKLPAAVSFTDAAVLPVGGMTALHLLKKVTVKQGDRVLVYGASGSVGTYAVQLAKYFGARVTGVCSTPNVPLVQSLGADRVIDYVKEDWSKSDQRYDVVFDAVGKITKSQCRKILTNDGSFLSVRYPTREKTDYLNFLAERAAAGDITPVIDRTYSLDQIAEAHRYVGTKRKKGNVVITV